MNKDMKKTVYEQIAVFVAAILATIVVFVITGAGLWDIINAVTDCIIYTAFILMLDDVAFKYFRYRALLCWKYWVGFALMCITVGSFTYASKTVSLLGMWLGLAATAIFGIGVLVYDAKVYNFIEPDQEGLEKTQVEVVKKAARKELKKMRKIAKRFSRMDAEAIKKVLYGNLRFFFVDDDATNDIEVERPLDADTLGTYSELSVNGPEAQAKAKAIKDYIDACVAKYIAKRDASKEEK